MLNVSGRACYLCFAAYLLPIRCACALPRSTRRLPLFMELLDRIGMRGPIDCDLQKNIPYRKSDFAVSRRR